MSETRHRFSQAYERLGDDTMVVVRCMTCQGNIVGAFYGWPSEMELDELHEAHTP